MQSDKNAKLAFLKLHSSFLIRAWKLDFLVMHKKQSNQNKFTWLRFNRLFTFLDRSSDYKAIISST